MTTDAFWPGICQVIEKPEWLAHERFGTLAGRLEHNRELISLLDELFAGTTADDWIVASARRTSSPRPSTPGPTFAPTRRS